MRVVVNAVAVRGGGARTFLLNLLPRLRAAEPEHDLLVVLARRQHELAAALPEGVRSLVCPSVPESPWLRVAWEQVALPGLLRREGADLLFAAFNTAVLCTRVPVVMVAHSVNAFSDLPIGWPAHAVLRHAALRWLGRLSARRARFVVFVSETAARVMAPRLHVPAGRTRVVHYGWTPLPGGEGASAASSLPPRYLLTVGDLLEHKNLDRLFTAFERLVRERGYPGHLVVVGSLDGASSNYGRALLARRAGLASRERIHMVGALPARALGAVYRGAELFVLPSLEETFGLPLVEAMGAGVPVVVADWRGAPGGDAGRTNVGPEVCGDVAEFFDPLDPGSLLAALTRVLGDPARRQELVRGGPARAARFSWERAAREFLAIFSAAVDRSGRL